MKVTTGLHHSARAAYQLIKKQTGIQKSKPQAASCKCITLAVAELAVAALAVYGAALIYKDPQRALSAFISLP